MRATCRWIAVLLAALLPCVSVASAGERLIVFTQPGVSPLAERFAAESLPKLEALASEMGVELVTVDVASAGAPADVTLTPLVAFQNHRGRSIYQGRYETFDRVRNFVRTARFMPQGNERLGKQRLPVRTLGRTTLATPVKLTALGGNVPQGHDAAAFERAALQAIARGMNGYTLAERVELGRGDRLFYVDYHPFLADDGTLFVSTELYSQFHCHEPVWSGLMSPVSGPFDDAAAVFAAAAKTLAEEIDRQLATSTLGDGFDTVGHDVPVVSWEALGLPLPPAPQGPSVNVADVSLGSSWVIDAAAQQQRPAVQFAFPAPLDGYSGEATRVTGTLTLATGPDNHPQLPGATGRFEADPASVTMGEPDLDDHIHSSLLEVRKHPASWFELREVQTTQTGLVAFNTVYPATLAGAFTMKGITIDLSVPASVEAFVGDDGRPRLSIDAAWPLDLRTPFNLDGPPGPADASGRLRLNAHLVFAPAP